ncbi:hypothetical protein EGI26_14905 [Lacihabitans sp. CCS-44]|uniref:hypothetical protein n=1 Tax=Lacihabitans sp. CCS-44 TaxID=2487331 RepID=UPI0020CF4D70|nr:hypothetical protein [Lacihabitans sp. CCS-44]MCP9756452.1 hypothetical protein [Lacihabitans sp. CCS-44]
MNPFFNSIGNIIGFESESNLFNLRGIHFARYVPEFGIYVALNGNYIGEIISNQYLLVRDSHGYENQNFGKCNQISKIKIPLCLTPKGYLGFHVSNDRFSDILIKSDDDC